MQMIALIFLSGKKPVHKKCLKLCGKWFAIIINGGEMAVHQDFEDMLRCLNEEKAKYLIVGAHAVSFYTEPRYTKDIDIWIDPAPENAKRVYSALRKFGAPLADLDVGDLSDTDKIYQLGIAPVRIDIMMGPGGIDFSTAWKKRKTTTFGKEKVYIIGIEDLIKLKKTASRPQDKIDLKKLAKVKA